jgi:hypothetical protein
VIHPDGKPLKRGFPIKQSGNGTEIPPVGWYSRLNGELLPSYTLQSPWNVFQITRTARLSTKNAYPKHFGDFVFFENIKARFQYLS